MTLIATDAAPKLSNPSKMPGKSWSLQAGDTCPGKKVEGELDPVCGDCYAQRGRYEFANVVDLRAHNREDWQKDGWVEAMTKLIGKRKYFRWFDSGDVYSLALAEKIFAVMAATPNTRHWLPTRMGRFAKFAPILEKMDSLPNAVVRHSAFGYDTLPNGTGSMVYTSQSAPDGVHACQAYMTASGTCRKAGCFACWDKDTKIIGYPAH